MLSIAPRSAADDIRWLFELCARPSARASQKVGQSRAITLMGDDKILYSSTTWSSQECQYELMTIGFLLTSGADAIGSEIAAILFDAASIIGRLQVYRIIQLRRRA